MTVSDRQESEEHHTIRQKIVSEDRRESQATQPGARKRIRIFWWARRRPESPEVEKPNCQRVNCARSGMTPFDLYCQGETGNAHFMPLAASGAGRLTIASLAVGAVALAGGAGMLSATIPSPIPLYGAAGVIGLLLLGLPLRYFSSSRSVAVIGWLTALVVVVVWREQVFSTSTERWIVAGVAAALLLAFVVTTTFYNDALAPDDDEPEVASDPESDEDEETALLLGAAVGLAVFVLVLKLVAVPVSSDLTQILLIMAGGLFILAFLVAAQTGFVVGIKEATYSREFRQPARNRCLKLSSRKIRVRQAAGHTWRISVMSCSIRRSCLSGCAQCGAGDLERCLVAVARGTNQRGMGSPCDHSLRVPRSGSGEGDSRVPMGTHCHLGRSRLLGDPILGAIRLCDGRRACRWSDTCRGRLRLVPRISRRREPIPGPTCSPCWSDRGDAACGHLVDAYSMAGKQGGQLCASERRGCGRHALPCRTQCRLG